MQLILKMYIDDTYKCKLSNKDKNIKNVCIIIKYTGCVFGATCSYLAAKLEHDSSIPVTAHIHIFARQVMMMMAMTMMMVRMMIRRRRTRTRTTRVVIILMLILMIVVITISSCLLEHQGKGLR